MSGEYAAVTYKIIVFLNGIINKSGIPLPAQERRFEGFTLKRQPQHTKTRQYIKEQQASQGISRRYVTPAQAGTYLTGNPVSLVNDLADVQSTQMVRMAPLGR